MDAQIADDEALQTVSEVGGAERAAGHHGCGAFFTFLLKKLSGVV